jgi:hypothetical protein
MTIDMDMFRVAALPGFELYHFCREQIRLFRSMLQRTNLARTPFCPLLVHDTMPTFSTTYRFS